MELTSADRALVAAIQDGLPLTPRPYADIGRCIGLGEEEVISALRRMLDGGIIKRLGIVVRHHELGYRANAMVVWDLPDDGVDEIGRRFSGFDFVTLCYRRPRRLPRWPYNLFCMVHGRERPAVLAQVDRMARSCEIFDAPREVLFSTRRFKQRGPVYAPGPAMETVS